MNYDLSKSAKIVLSKSIFYVKSQGNFFKKKSFENINLGDHFLENKYSFLTSIFEPLYCLKFGQKSCFLGPTIFEIPQQN